MSGGSFDYAYQKVEEFTESLDLKLANYDKCDEEGSRPHDYSKEVREKLMQINALVAKTAALMREVEWLYSGDTGEDSFLFRVGEIESSRMLGDFTCTQ